MHECLSLSLSFLPLSSGPAVRSAKFVARKQWIVCGADDMFIRVYNYNTMDKVKVFEAHQDYIRSLAVHPTLPYLLSSSDDMLIKLWDWDKNWTCVQVFEGHSHYVMQVVFNPKDTNTFASASLDRTVKVWSLGQPTPNFTLEGHDKGVNCVDYFSGGDRPYLISGADDKLAKVWDYQTKACVQTLEGHSHNISAVAFHPELPIILTGSEDGTVKMWHATTYRLENTLNYGMERVWAVGCCKGSNNVALGYDDGAIMIKVGREEPVASMDNSGKIIWARHNEIQTVNVKSLGADYEMTDGERLPLAVKDLGSCDLYPQALSHNPNGRFVVVCGDGEYIVYTALAWRNKSFGSGLEFAWGSDSSEYAVRDGSNKIKIFKNFQEKDSIKLDFAAEGLHGGQLIGVRSADFICFYDWAEGKCIRRIDANVKAVYWSEGSDLVAVVGETGFYVLKYNRDLVEEHLSAGRPLDEDGIEDAFELLNEVSERVKTGLWVGDCFIYTNSAWRLNYVVGGEMTTMFHLDRPLYLLGYLAVQNKIYLIDKDFSVVSYTMLLSMIEFKTLVMRGDLESALSLLESIPKDQHNTVARFLESRGLMEEALSIATEADYRFDLSIQLGHLDIAQEIASSLESEAKWKQLGELAMNQGELEVAHQCLVKARDLSGLLMMYSAQGNSKGMERLAAEAHEQGKHNVGFLANFLLGRVEQCLDILVETGRLPEACLFARTYLPSKMSELVTLWKQDLATLNAKAADSLADPQEYPNLFPNLDIALKAETFASQQRKKVIPAKAYPHYEGASLTQVLEQMAEININEEDAVPGSNGARAFEDRAVNGGMDTEEDFLPEAPAPSAIPRAEAPPPAPLEQAPPPVAVPSPPLTTASAPTTPPPATLPPPPPPAMPTPLPSHGAEAKEEDEDDDVAGFGEGEDVDDNIELDDDWGLEEEEEQN